MVVEEAESSLPSSSEGRTENGASCFELQNKVKKTPNNVAAISQRQ